MITDTVYVEGSDLVLVRSDAGDGAWSLHAAGSTDEQIAHGNAPALLTGEAKLVGGTWNAPTQSHRAAAALIARQLPGQGLTPPYGERKGSVA